ncbi:hypothetical protein [Megalodesulfovibrio paquesii]
MGQGQGQGMGQGRGVGPGGVRVLEGQPGLQQDQLPEEWQAQQQGAGLPMQRRRRDGSCLRRANRG